MRILSLRFRNLNSLAGDWSIDFRAPEYEASGIFAITGPTGAGKSTILDAICLALYGSTPRLPNISKNVNDIMTRGTGDCYADVTFRTSKGEFRCRWSQRRARGKADGNLQQPRHELFDAKGTPMADKVLDVARMVEELTGMDYGRFTQSTLLAQGRFATFLLAEGRDRAPLLEQLTGTAIYSKISEHIYQRHKEEQAKLDSLDAELGHCSVLSDEEELAIREECSKISQAIVGTTEQEKELTAGLHIIQLFSTLEQEQKALLDGQKELEGEEEAFSADKGRLETARRALHFAGACSALLARQKEQEHDAAESCSLSESLIPLADDVQKEESLHALAVKKLEEVRNAHAGLLETLKGVRALDIQLKERLQEMAQREAAEKEAVRHEAAVCASLGEHKKHLAKNRATLSETKAWIESRAMDAELPQRLSALRISATQLFQQKKRIEARKLILEDKRHALDIKALSCDEQRKLHSALAEESKTLAEEVALLDAERLDCLSGKNPADWRKDLEKWNVLDARLGRMQDISQKRDALLMRCEELDSKLNALALNIEREQALLRSEEARLNDLQALRQEVVDSLALLERIRSYEEARLLLEEGMPCPLCGALHHPYAEGNVPMPEEKREQLQSCEQKINLLTDALSKRRASLAALESDKEHCTSLLREKSTEAKELAIRFDREADALPPHAALSGVANSDELAEALTGHRKDCQLALADISALLEKAEEIQGRLQSLREKLETTRKDTEQAQRGLTAIAQEKTALDAEVRAIELELDGELFQYEALFDSLRLELTPLGHIPHQAEELPGILQKLEDRIEEFQQKQKEFEQLSSSSTELEKRCLVEEQERNDAGKRLLDIREALARVRESLDALKAQRHELFGDKDADDAEEDGVALLNDTEAEKNARATLLDAARKKWSDNTARLAMLQQRLAERAESLATDGQALEVSLRDAGFHCLRHCLDSCLDNAERTALEERERTLKERKTSLHARLEDNVRRRAELPPRPEKSEEELRSSFEKLKELQSALQEELGAKREKLESNEERKKTASEVLQSRHKQEAVCRRWADLSKLIGSADGQKFRNYAQELTFRSLIRHANRQLSSMTDRYVLVQSPEEPLSLSVIDHYQADAVRTSRNLSGGESFLVSLSLALGLARMASLSVSVDSVFLDEGFGTLDEDSLNMALDMLASLRQQGKIIGIISHVQAIRERIGTRIQVEAEGNGRSSLNGPGIQKVHRQIG